MAEGYTGRACSRAGRLMFTKMMSMSMAVPILMQLLA